ncbi:MAG: 50S ribosomal protein L4 [bacterium]
MAVAVKVFDEKGQEYAVRELKDSVFGVALVNPLVSQAVRVLQWNGTSWTGAHTKTRGEVRGGGRKPWRQKGTGRARQGSRRSPQWVGGGVVFGPRGERRRLKLNKKMRARAITGVLSQKLKDEELMFIKEFDFEKPSTKLAREYLGKIGAEAPRVLWITPGTHTALARSLRNIKEVTLRAPNGINLLDLLKAHRVVMTERAVDAVEEAWGK